MLTLALSSARKKGLGEIPHSALYGTIATNVAALRKEIDEKRDATLLYEVKIFGEIYRNRDVANTQIKHENHPGHKK
jgi:hypothetical protein